MNRRLALLLATLLSVAASNAAGRDGDWWNRLEPSQKLAYVTGFFDGTTYAAMLTTGVAIKISANPQTGKYDPSRGEIAKEVNLATIDAIGAETSKVTPSQLVGGLDTTYADYRNLNVGITDAMYAVVRSIKGTSDVDIQRFLESKRRESSK